MKVEHGFRGSIVGRRTDAPLMFLGHRAAHVRIGVQPEDDRRLNDPLGVGKVPCAIFFECFEDLRIEPVGALNGFELNTRLGFPNSLWHRHSIPVSTGSCK